MTALLATVVVWSLLKGMVPSALSISAGLVLGFLLRSGHSHAIVFRSDALARHSRFSTVNPCLKLIFSVGMLFFCVFARTPWPPLCLFVLMAGMTCAGGTNARAYWSALTIPALFLMAGGLAILWQYSPVPCGLAQIPFGAGYLVLQQEAQSTARLVTARALGAVGCLYFLSFTTTVPELIEALRRFHVPDVVLDLSILIYRYLFLLLFTFRDMQNAAASRLGFTGPVRSIRTTGILYGNLLARSFRRAQSCFDAMESRCCTGSIRFYTRKKPVRIKHIAVGAVLLCAMAAALLYGG